MDFITFLESDVSKYSHILRDWGRDFYITTLEWGTIQPLPVTMVMTMMIVMLPWSKGHQANRHSPWPLVRLPSSLSLHFHSLYSGVQEGAGAAEFCLPLVDCILPVHHTEGFSVG